MASKFLTLRAANSNIMPINRCAKTSAKAALMLEYIPIIEVNLF